MNDYHFRETDLGGCSIHCLALISVKAGCIFIVTTLGGGCNPEASI